ncbi:3-deoxy-7-phosphoheptulonate synthase [Candidatus Micrarchaeota archaeon]|nr:3-deoxy-7-phosphoheptulonate synthase [Candidatus Micrarchaeota archaeon]
MIVVFEENATKEQIDKVFERLQEWGFTPVLQHGEQTSIAITGDSSALKTETLEAFDGVMKAVRLHKPYKLVAKEFRPEGTVIEMEGGVKIGGKDFAVIAGPCSVEEEEQYVETAHLVKKTGCRILRAAVFKPRTSPYDFQGVGEKGLPWLKRVKDETGLLLCTEVMDPKSICKVEKHVDMYQVGARNMQNYDLLRALGKSGKPVLLKRGLSGMIKEMLLAAEYIMSSGNHDVIMCERGIRTYETATRFTLDISAVPVLNQMTHLPVIVDPSHPAGKRAYVNALAKAGVAVGADGLIVEVHKDPERAWSDGPQQLTFEQFEQLMKELEPIVNVMGKKLNGRTPPQKGGGEASGWKR